MPDTEHLPIDDFRRHGHYLVDWIADYLEGLAERPVLPDVEPGDIRAMVAPHAPEAPEPMEAILADLDRVVMPGISHWQHPGWFAFFPASSSPASVLGELATAGLAVQGMMWSTSPAATEIESAVLDWLVELLDLPRSWRIDTGPGGGSIQMSASDSTHASLVVARHLATDGGASTDSLVAYGSEQAHSSIEKGARIAGFRHIRTIEVDAVHAMRPAALAAAIEADLAAGLVPVWVCSTVGTTGTAAVDPVAEIGAVAAASGLWHHVDAAYAGSAMLCPELRHLQAGLETVDSYTFNPHKWLLTNFDCSAFWVADRSKLVDTMSVSPPYLRNDASETGQVVDYRDWHVSLGRRFRSLKLWFVLRSYGAEGLRRHIRGHLDLAREFSMRVESDPRLDLVAPTTFALVSFRHRDGDAATRNLAEAINASSRFYVNQSVVDDRPFIRVSIGSTWTDSHQVEGLWELIDQLA